MISHSSGTSTLPQPRIIPSFTIDGETLEHLKKTSPLHYLVAVACLKDGRWRLINPSWSDLPEKNVVFPDISTNPTLMHRTPPPDIYTEGHRCDSCRCLSRRKEIGNDGGD
jgi:hypothetical protein